MARVVGALVLGLIGAGIVHIAIVLTLPHIAERTAWSRLADRGPPNALIPLDELSPAEAVLASPDPDFMAAACRFDLAEGMVEVGSPVSVPFWSAAVYDRNGISIFSLNDRSTANRALDFVVLTPDQMIEARRDLPGELGQTVFTEVATREGIVLVRAFVPDPSWTETIADFFAQMRCVPR